MILDPNGIPILQPAIDNAETATFNTAFAAIGTAIGTAIGDITTFGTVTPEAGYTLGAATKLARVGDIVVLTYSISKTDGGNLPKYITLATVQSGFRAPNGFTFAGAGVAPGVDDYMTVMSTSSAGVVSLNKVDGGATVKTVSGSVTWTV